MIDEFLGDIEKVRGMVRQIESVIRKGTRPLSLQEEVTLEQARMYLDAMEAPMQREVNWANGDVAYGKPRKKKNKPVATPQPRVTDGSIADALRHFNDQNDAVHRSFDEAARKFEEQNPKRCLRSEKIADMDARLARILGTTDSPPEPTLLPQIEVSPYIEGAMLMGSDISKSVLIGNVKW